METTNEIHLQCEDCLERNDTVALHDIENTTRNVCESCMDNYTTCEDCDNQYHEDNIRYINDSRNICNDCYSNYHLCSGCDYTYHENDSEWIDGDDGYCVNCYSGSDNLFRAYSNDILPEFVSEQAGRIITSQRYFGIELETVLPDSDSAHNVSSQLSDYVGLSEDGSIRAEGGIGIEIQSPKCAGKNGEQAVKDICQVLNDNDAKVNTSTGFHVHIGAKDIAQSPSKVKTLLALYINFDSVLQAMLPESRRNNRYCKSLTEFNSENLLKTRMMSSIERLWYKDRLSNISNRKGHKYDNSRYYGINFHSLFYRGTIEVRYHNGTTNADKILKWTALHTLIVDKVANGEILPEAITSAEKTVEGFLSLITAPQSLRQYVNERIAKHLINQNVCVES